MSDIVELPLSKILVQDDWNSRSGNLAIDSGDDTEHSISDLILSIENDGQKTPVEVCKIIHLQTPYMLVAGFRRITALRKISEKTGTDVTVKAVILQLDAVSARARNLTENIERQNLKPADIAWGLRQLQIELHNKKQNATYEQVCRIVGRKPNNQYLQTLLRIMNNCTVEVTDAWRNSPVIVPMDSMAKICQMPQDSQLETFRRIQSDPEFKKVFTKLHRSGDHYTQAEREAKKVLKFLVRLEKCGAIDTSNLDFGMHLDMLLSTVHLTPKEKDKLSHYLYQEYTLQMRES